MHRITAMAQNKAPGPPSQLRHIDEPDYALLVQWKVVVTRSASWTINRQLSEGILTDVS
jgi:hypothetical protein